MTDGRRLVVLLLLSFAVWAGIFGTLRGMAETGPGHGVRFVATIAPPVTSAAREMVEHTARDRVGERDIATRVVTTGDQLVVEFGDDDPLLAAEVVRLLQRTPKLELRAVDANSAWL